MYEGYPEEVIDKIKELGLYGNDLREIMIISVNACTEIIKWVGPAPTKLKKDIEQLQKNQINLMDKIHLLK